jgi:hypothetical protein
MRGPWSNGAAFVRATVLLAACALGAVACTDGTTPDCSDAQCQVLVEEAAAGDAGADAAASDGAGADASEDSGAGGDASADAGSGAVGDADAGAVADAGDGASE